MIDARIAQRLAHAARNGDDETRAAVVGELFEAMRRPLAALCLRMTCDPSDAEDAVQEAAVDTLRGIGQFRSDARLSTWLWRIAIRAALRVRSRRQRHDHGQSDLDLAETDSSTREPGEIAAARERSRRLMSAMERLPAHQRVVIALSALDGMPQTEIAEVLGIPVGTVHSRLHGARERLKVELAS